MHGSAEEANFAEKFSLHERDIVALQRVVSGHATVLSEHAKLVDHNQARELISDRCNILNYLSARQIREIGSVDNNIDCTKILTDIISSANGQTVVIPSGCVVNVVDLQVPSDTTLLINGELRLAAGAPSGSAILKNANGKNGDSNILIYGNGCISGNKKKQAINAWHELISFFECSFVDVDILKAGWNRFSNDVDHTIRGAAIHFDGGNNNTIRIARLIDYGREGVWADNVSDSSIHASSAFGGEDSWSGFQMGGHESVRNSLVSLRSVNAGASAIGCDSKDSLVAFCSAVSPRYFNGFNLGHEGKVSDRSRVISCTAFNAAGYGFSVVNGSTDVSLVDCISLRAQKSGFNVSAGASRVYLERCTSRESADFGLNNYNGHVEVFRCNLSANTKGSYKGGSDATVQFISPVAPDGHDKKSGVLHGTQECLKKGIKVESSFIKKESNIVLTSYSASAAEAQPFIVEVGDGYCVINFLGSCSTDMRLGWAVFD